MVRRIRYRGVHGGFLDSQGTGHLQHELRPRAPGSWPARRCPARAERRRPTGGAAGLPSRRTGIGASGQRERSTVPPLGSGWLLAPGGPEESPGAGLGVQEELGAELELYLQSTPLAPFPQNCGVDCGRVRGLNRDAATWALLCVLFPFLHLHKDISSLTQLKCLRGLSHCPGMEGKD